MLSLGLKEQVTRDTRQSVTDRDRKSGILPMYSIDACGSQARRRILGHKHCKLPPGRPVFPQNGIRTDSIFGQVRDTTVQVWTVGEGFGIGSEFRQTRCAANNFRVHKVLFHWFKCSCRSPSGFAIHRDERTERSTRSPSVLAHYCTLTSIVFGFGIGRFGR